MAAAAADLEVAVATVEASAEDLAAVAADSVADIITDIITIITTDPVFTADSGGPDAIITAAEAALAA